MLKLISTITLLIICSSVFAESGFNFLRTEKSPLVISSAQTSYLFTDSPENTAYNPASGFGSDRINGKISYLSLFENADATQIAASYNNESHFYGIEISYLNIGGLEGRDVPSEEPAYEFGSKNIILAFTYGYEIMKGLKAGVSGKYLFEKIEYDDSYGFAGSFGLFRDCFLLDGLNLAVSVNNFGNMNELDKVKTELPIDAVVGAGYGFGFAEDFVMNIANSTRYLIEDEETENYSGLELGYKEKIALRFGYRADNEGSPFSVGAGFEVGGFTIDYSYTPFSDDALNDSHSLSVAYSIK